MVEVVFEEVLIYGFALFFVFAALVLLIVRYSNKQLLHKIFLLEKMFGEETAKLDKEMRKIVLINSREKKELLEEIEKLKEKNQNSGNKPENKNEKTSVSSANKIKVLA